MSQGRPPTIKTVAARAGVGRTTVSRVLNGSELVSTEARARVLKAIEELNYVPNSVARGLVTSRTESVALVIPESESRLGSEPFFAALIRGVSGALTETGTQLQLVLVRDQLERDQLTASIATRRVDGVLLVSVRAQERVAAMLEEMRLPTVLAGRRGEDERLSYVTSDNVGGATAAPWTWTWAWAGSRAGAWRTSGRACGRTSRWWRPGTSPRRAVGGRCVHFSNARRIWTPSSPRPT
jgi:DNA-binding LacI/PurR family transcriptional regulator